MKSKSTTISGYKKSTITSLLKKKIMEQQIGLACYWGCELDLSNFTKFLWLPKTGNS